MRKIGLGILIGLVVLVIGGIVIARGIERNPAIVLPPGIEVEVPDQTIDNSLVLVKGVIPGEFVSDEIIVKFKGDTQPFRVTKVPEGKVGEKIKEFKKRVDVVYAEPNYIAYALMVPNDPYYKYQWHLDNPKYGGIQMEKAWDISTGSNSVVVAIVDTGIAYETYGKYCQAPDLAQTCFKAGYDFVNGDTHPNDDYNHGTHVAGTVAQSTNNSLGVAGVAFNTCLIPVKVLDSRGSGTYTNVANGIYFAVNGPDGNPNTGDEAQVINLSLGGTSDSQTLKDAVAYAYQKGVTVIAACGNDNTSSCLYPAAYDDYVIAVGATQYNETKAPYSSYGPSLDLVAPGGNTSLDQNKDGYADGVLQQTFKNSLSVCTFGYYFFQGTSMATPHVSGVAALLLAKGNATTPDQVRTALQNTAKDLGALGRDDTYGWGLVNAYAALGWTAVKTCSTDADCSDGLYCNGTETCVAGVCQAGTPINCSDGVACTVDSCDETIKACVNTPNNALCDDGLYCNGAETCNVTLGCQLGTPVVCNDGNECTTDTCSEALKACQYTNVADNTVCTGGVCCSGKCTTGVTQCPTAVKCWSGTNLYLYRATDQARKFCKCASGIYGYKSYTSKILKSTVYKYVNTGDNKIWDVTPTSSKLPISQVTCTDGKTYSTNRDYFYPK